MRKRRPGVLAATLAAALALAGCGSGAHAHASAAAGPGGHAGTGSPQSSGQISKAQARAFVKAVNLRASDLPGFKGSVKHHASEQKRFGAALRRCLGAGAEAAGDGREAGALAKGGSEEYKREGSGGLSFVQSEVSVARSAAAAALKVAALRSPRVRYCMQRYLNLLVGHLSPHGVRLGRVSVGRVTPPARGTAGGYGWSMTVPITVRGISVPLRMEILGFVYGPADVTLTSGSLPLPFPGPEERSLYLLLLERAESHVL